MFDIGFWELATIAVIGIVVVGPDKLPEVVRSVMKTVHKIRRMFDDVKHDIERELDIDEIRRMVHQADIEEHIQKLNQSVMDATQDLEKGGKDILNDIDREISQLDAEQDGEISEVSNESNFEDYQSDPEAQKDTGIESKTSNMSLNAAKHGQRKAPL